MNSVQFNSIVDDYSDNVYRFILKSTKNTDNAKDIVQESFSRLWKNKDSVDVSKAKSYLFTIAYRVMIDDFRKRKNNPRLRSR